MEIKTLEGTDTKATLNAFNASFSDYFIPFKLSEEQLASKMQADKTDLNLSVGVFENGNLIAFILHGFDEIEHEKVVYNGGTGVIPTKRGFGLTKQMHLFILPILKQRGINKLVLEVITQNIQAIKSYEQSGYQLKRELACYEGNVNISNTNNHLNIKKLPDYDWGLMQSFWDIDPTWQNAKHVVTELKDSNISLGAWIENQLVGYVIYNPARNRIQQIAIGKNFRGQKIASSLLSEVMRTFGNTLSIINVDKGSTSFPAFLERIGLKTTFEQVEMELVLNER